MAGFCHTFSVSSHGMSMSASAVAMVSSPCKEGEGRDEVHQKIDRRTSDPRMSIEGHQIPECRGMEAAEDNIRRQLIGLDSARLPSVFGVRT